MAISIPEQYQSLKTKLETIVKKVVSPQEITANSDLNDYTEAGFYYCRLSATDLATLSNAPNDVTTGRNDFSLLVENTNVYGNGVKQTLTTFVKSNTYVRNFYMDYDGNHRDTGWKPLYEDTGWQDLSFTSGFNHYWTEQKAQYRRVGKIVQIRGAIKNTKEISAGDTNIKMATITDTTCRPSQGVNYIQQGSGAGVHLISINTSGEVSISRNRLTGTSGYSKINAGSWINIEYTFFVD